MESLRSKARVRITSDGAFHNTLVENIGSGEHIPLITDIAIRMRHNQTEAVLTCFQPQLALEMDAILLYASEAPMSDAEWFHHVYTHAASAAIPPSVLHHTQVEWPHIGTVYAVAIELRDRTAGREEQAYRSATLIYNPQMPSLFYATIKEGRVKDGWLREKQYILALSRLRKVLTWLHAGGAAEEMIPPQARVESDHA